MIKWVVIIIFTLLSMTGFAQPQAPAPNDFGDPGVPIDGISSLIIAGGIIFGGKKAYDLKKKNEEN